MALPKKRVLTELRDIGLFLLVGIVMTYFTCTSCRYNLNNYILISSLSMFMWIFLWKGNSFLAHILSEKISWIDFPVRRMIIGLITTVAYTVLAVIGIITIYKSAFQVNVGNVQWMVYSSILITIVISLVLHSRAFLQHWQKAKVEAEKFEKESISAKYESLKSQVNPHFLFNNLNALTNLVYEDQEKAVKFIKQLSEVYRYVLDTRDREVVPLEEEIKFINAYIFLQQIRFGNKLKIDVQLNGTKCMVAPLSLQMLIENAIKHNVISEENPLSVKVYAGEHYLTVENNLQKKMIIKEDSPKLGLENIKKRYEYLSDKKVIVEESASKFVVHLPFIKEI